MAEPQTEFEHLKALTKGKGSGDLDRRYELVEEIEKLFPRYTKDGKIENWNGHLLNGAYFYTEGWFESAEKRLQRMLDASMMRLVHLGNLEDLHAALKAGVRLEKPIEIPTSYREFDCPHCGTRLQLAFNGEGFEVFVEDPCPYPKGLITEFELNVPSGKIMVDDDLRQWFPVEEDYDVNQLIGCHRSSVAAAKNGFAYGFVGNTSPDVYRNGDDKFVIGSYREGYCEKDENGEWQDLENPEPCPWGESVASICTDLWWYSIADFDEFKRRRQHYTPDKPLKEITEFWTFNVVDVKPGVYRFRQEQGIDRDQPTVVYAAFEWVRDPDLVVDYLGAEQAKDYNATEVLIQGWMDHIGMWEDAKGSKKKVDFVALWNEKTPEEKVQSLAHPADGTMCVLGGGVEWHEKGFPRMPVSDEAKQLAAEYGDVPAFDFKTHWYPISAGYGGLCLGAGVTCEYTKRNAFIDLAPSFVLLGLNICQNAIKFGEEPRLNTDVYPPAYEIPFCRERMERFAECYRGLRKRNPDLVFDAEFDSWMADEDAVKKHIAEFDFGPEHPPKEKWGDPPVTVKKGEFFEFDAMALDSGHFCWAAGCWASKENAERYAIGALSGTQSAMGHLHVEASARAPSMIPLKAVGRVVRGTGDGHSSSHLVVSFDYGTENMRDEMAFNEEDMKGVRQFDSAEEYAELLEAHKIEFAKIQKKAKKKAKKKAR